MTRRRLIPLAEVCDYLRIDVEIISEFANFGICSTVDVDGEVRIEARDLETLLRAVSLHQSLGVNKEGIEVILKLRESISLLQEEVEGLRYEVARVKERLAAENPERLKALGLLIEIE